ncbi:MAG: AraC family transcriptional regulator [Rhizonema sp. PD37]|nr:AraC family transcriptional regulator [Rhizonema sp. PD37]
MLRNRSNPPSFIDLAKHVGINECTLKRGFCQIFETTVFGYLHNYCMEQARQLLLLGQMKIEQVAYSNFHLNELHDW